MDDNSAEQWDVADEEGPEEPAPGVKLVRTLRGHTGWIGRIAWSPDGRMLASPSADETIRLWDAETGECLRTLEGHKEESRASPLIRRAASWPAGMMTKRSSCGRRPAGGCCARWKGTRRASVASPLIRRAVPWPAGVRTDGQAVGGGQREDAAHTLEGHPVLS